MSRISPSLFTSMISFALSNDAKAHSKRVADYVRTLMKAQGGSISFRDYMDAVLYAPKLGYYVAGADKFGEGGDFVTAPELTDAFGKTLAELMIPSLTGLPVVFELGAGSGKLAADILLALQAKNALPKEYWILDVSPDLKKRQQEFLQQAVPFFFPHIKWLSTLPKVPYQAFILANEVLDALPVNRFVMTKNQAVELGVTSQGEHFAWCERSPLAIDLPTELSDGYRSEINLALPAFLKALTANLKAGALLWIDYGYEEADYYHPSRTEGTLRCHYRHQVDNDPFALVGLKDITSHVNFSYLAENLIDLGFTLDLYASQAECLAAFGIGRFLQGAPGESLKIKRLMDPRLMGEIFKMMLVSKNVNLPPLPLMAGRKRFL